MATTLEEDMIGRHGYVGGTRPTGVPTLKEMQATWKSKDEARGKKFTDMGMFAPPDKLMGRDEFDAWRADKGFETSAATQEQNARWDATGDVFKSFGTTPTPGADVFQPIIDSKLPGTKQDQYYSYVQGQEGWNSDWNQYQKQIMQKLHNPDYDLATGGVPQDVIDSLSSFAGGIDPMSGDGWGYDPNAGPGGGKLTGPPKPSPNDSKEAQYFNYLRSQEGWNPEWDDYYSQILHKLRDPDYNMSENIMRPGGLGMSGVPQEIIAQLSEFYGGVEPMSGEWGYQDPGATTQPGEYVDPGYGYVDPGADYYQNQMNILKEQGNLQELANRNAIKRQILARMMNKRSSLDA